MTEQRRFEQAPPAGPGDLSRLVAENPAALKALFDGIPARVVVVSGEERLLYANYEFYRFSGLTPEAVIGAHVGQIIGREGYEVYLPARERILGGEAMHWEGWVTLPNHGARYTRESLVPYGPPGDPPRAIIVMSLDITEQKLREQELAQKVRDLEAAESLKASIVDNALAALVSTDVHGRIVEFNPAAEKMFGHMRVAVLGKLVGEIIIPARYHAAHTAGMARLLSGGAAKILGKRMELEALRADGSEFPVEMVLWRTGVGETVHYTASLNDLSERREAAMQLQRERERLRQSEKLTAMGSLLAGVAHELNNPLAVVMGRADLLAEKAADYPALKDDVQRIREAAERCGRIVRTFLNMARSRPAVYGATSLNDLARGALDMLAYTFRTHGIECVLELGDELPLVEADGDQIGQVILNLLVNAQQALAQHAGTRRVTLSTGSDRDGVWLRVRDSGSGVPEALRERIFEPFFTTKAEGVGTGLGLAVSRSIVRDHGGDLLLEPDAQDGGASLQLWLPLRAKAAVAAAGVPATATAAPTTQARILVVDDEPEIADMMRSIIERAGHEVASAESGAVALELLDAARFDAIITDLRMPDMDGAALWRAVRERHPQLAARMLFVTGDTLSPDASTFLSAQRARVLDKPFAAKDLRERLDALLAQRD